jgi:8-oxo-dGTP diphosphatase
VLSRLEAAPVACGRECREELGIEIPIGRLLVIDHQNDGGETGDSIMFVYDGGSIALERLTQPTNNPEVRALAFVNPTDLDCVTIPRLANRIRSALAARTDGTVNEAVDGRTR